MSRIFLSHSSVDNAHALAMRDWLAQEGWDDVFLDLDPDRGIVAGERWERRLHEAANRCEAVIFLVSSAWLKSEWCLREFHLAEKLNKRIFSVVIGKLKKADLPADVTRTWQFVDLAQGQDHDLFRVTLPDGEESHVTYSRSGLARLRNGLTKSGIDPRFFAWPPAHDPERAPYRGLKPLEAEDAGIFFGREAPIIEALDRLRGLREAAPPRLFVILGASGAGKSSFLRAGLWPRLQRDDRYFLPLPIVRPERAVLSGETGLIQSLDQACRSHKLKRSRAEIRKALEAGAMTAAQLLADLASAAKPADGEAAPTIVLAVDQAEELFQAAGREEADAVLRLIGELAGMAAPRCIIVFTIRSDAYEPLQTAKALEGLRPLLFSLSPIPAGAWGAVIEGPAKRMSRAGRKLAIEPALTHRLLADLEAGGGKDALPLLAFTLERLFTEYGGDGDLKLAEYEEFGGISGAIDAAVAQAMKAADSDSRVPADTETRRSLLRRALIPWLSGIDPDTGSPRRFVARFSEIPEEARPLVEHLVNARLLSTDGDLATGNATIEPAHEALLRQWSLLNGWLVEDAASLATLEAVRRATRDWLSNRRDKAWLNHRASRLEDAERLHDRPDLAAKLDAEDRAYLAACREAENEQRDKERLAAEREARAARRTRIAAVAATILAVIASAAAWYGWEQRTEALQKRDEANKLAEIADAQRAIAESKSEEARRQTEIANAERLKAEESAKQAEIRRQEALTQDFERVSASAESLLEEGAGNSPNKALALVIDKVISQSPADADTSPRIGAALTKTLLSTLTPIQRNLGENVFALAVSGDGNRIAAGTIAGDLYVFDATKMALISAMRAVDGLISGLDFSQDGREIVVAGVQVPTVWNIETATKVHDLRWSQDRGFTKMAKYSPDGTTIAVSTSANVALLFDARTGTLLRELKGGTFEDSEKRAETLSRDGLQSIADPITRAVGAATFSMFGSTTEIEFSPDGKLLAVTGSSTLDRSAQLFDVTTGQEVHLLTGGKTSAFTSPMGYGDNLSFSSDGKLLVASPGGDAIKIWQVADGTLLKNLVVRDVEAFVLTRAGGALISGHRNGLLRFECLDETGYSTSIKAHDDVIGSLRLSHDGAFVVSASSDGTAKVWPVPDDTTICAAGFGADEGRIRALENLQPAAVLANHGAVVHGGLFGKDDQSVLTHSKDGILRKWNLLPVSAGRVSFSEPMYDYYQLDATSAAGFSQDDAQLLVSGDYGTGLQRWNIETVANSEWPHDWNLSLTPEEDAVSHDGDPYLFAVASKRGLRQPTDGFAELFDTETGNTLARLEIKDVSLKRIALSADGTRAFATFADEDTIANDRIGLAAWDTRDGRPVFALESFPPATDDAMVAEIRFDNASTFRISSDGLAVATLASSSAGPLPLLFKVNGQTLDAVRIPRFRNGTDLAFCGRDRLLIANLQGGVEEIGFASEPSISSFVIGDHPITRIACAENGGRAAAVDSRNVMTVVDLATRLPKRRLALPFSVKTIAMSLNGRHVFVSDGVGTGMVVETDPLGDRDVTTHELAKWARAMRLDALSTSDRKQLGIKDAAPNLARVPGIPAHQVSLGKGSPAPGEDALACDRVATNPYDTLRRGEGIVFEALDGSAALSACKIAAERFPGDMTTIYQLGRAYDKLGQKEAALERYLAAAEGGYAIAMRGVARLIREDKSGAFGQRHGSPESWERKAAVLGDPWALVAVALPISKDYTDPARVDEALSLIAAAGIPNRAEAAINIAFWLDQEEQTAGLRKASAFYCQLGLALRDSYQDPAPFQNAEIGRTALERCLDIQAMVPMKDLIVVYDQAQAWLNPPASREAVLR